MMKQATQAVPHNTAALGFRSDTQMRHQLMREISCLERHLERLKTSGYMKDKNTLETYKDMILSRKQLLLELS